MILYCQVCLRFDQDMANPDAIDDMEAALFASFANKQHGKRGRKKVQEPEKADIDEPLQKQKVAISSTEVKAKERTVKPRTFGKLVVVTSIFSPPSFLPPPFFPLFYTLPFVLLLQKSAKTI